jgi:hypothetical protein
MAAVVLILLFCLGITEATGVTKLASTVIRLATNSGTLVIETNDPGVKITIDGEEITVRGGGIEELTMRPGDYEIVATKNGKPVKRELVTITRNGHTSLNISVESGDGNSVVSSKTPAGLADGNRALSFDGKDDHVNTPVFLDVRTPFTIEAVVTLFDFPKEHTFIVADIQRGGIGFGPTPDGKLQASLNIGKDGSPDLQGYRRLESTTRIPLDQPVHVAVTFDGQLMTLFIDGVMQS